MPDSGIVRSRPLEVKLPNSESHFARTRLADFGADRRAVASADVSQYEPDEMHEKGWSKFVRCRRLVTAPSTDVRVSALTQAPQLVLMAHS